MISIIILTMKSTHNAPRSAWPYMKTYDIWDTVPSSHVIQNKKSIELVDNGDSNQSYLHENHVQTNQRLSPYNNTNEHHDFNRNRSNGRKAKVINFFASTDSDDECLSDDARRLGLCLNTYECRIQGGTSKGDCALGFGVCCVFETTCNSEVNNNITYFVSPKFPAIMPNTIESCNLKVKLLSDDISQIRLDFVHFSLSQPNRKSGICDSDVFSIDGGVTSFVLCGQNTGQHMFYDIGSSKARNNKELKINMNFNTKSVSTRLWEIRITQIPFSSRAPSGCLQYFTGNEGIIQTFNFAENGRHLANQEYRSCVRQETGKCSISYEPCDENSFGIGPTHSNGMPGGPFMTGTGGMGTGGMGISGSTLTIMQQLMQDYPLISDPPMEELADESMTNEVLADPPADEDVADDDATGDADDVAADDAAANDPASNDPAADDAAANDPQDDPVDNDPAADDPAADEGSGGGDGGGFFDGFPSFSFPSFFSRRSMGSRSFKDFKHMKHMKHLKYLQSSSRQIYSPCRDRITLPCIVEDFIGAGMGDIPTCIPVHCGNSLCQRGASSCHLETSVTPFGIGVHFGDGKDEKGSPEDNIGACLRYKQISCS
ncbi:unnamed protein product [Diamesa hyperborea]